MESIDSRIPKKSKQVSFSDKYCALCKSMEGRTNRTTLVTVTSTMPTVLPSRKMGAQVAREEADTMTETVQTREIAKGQIMLS